ncbi:uncharacterized protein EKO05_0010667 [Ascochyta rabiei]|uniref:uncharacterized protein n=1 Tax=Didymella rabiei TaxID=5454 RepID=UPI0022015484|nr:uncharacterized protein EKO05_0010667 [Ascochyta rabiei]UPX20436.1 hypothetical protein EKO05_0010667 [Ascochyta rabiei]
MSLTCNQSGTSLPKSSSGHKVDSKESARKKARIDRESELESLMVDICLKKIEQTEQSRAQLTKSARDIMTNDLKNIFYKLKSVNEEGYTAHIQHLDAACVSLADLKARKINHTSNSKIGQTELDAAQQEVRKAVLNFFDRNGLLRLHALLKGNGRWQALLRGLALPLTGLRNLDANLRFQKNDIERQLKSEVSDLLAWLTPCEVHTSVPSSTSYSNTSTRNNDKIVVETQLDEQRTQRKADLATLRMHGDQAGNLRSAKGQVSSLHNDHAQQQQQQPVSNSIVLYALSDAHFKDLLAQSSSTGNAKASTTKADQTCPELPNAIESFVEHQGQESALPANIQTAGPETQWGSNQNTAMVLARSVPQQMADVRAAEELKQKTATLSKLQAYGQAYSIVIGQLKDAQNGGPTPTFVEDLQMPDAEACYYRLESLWNRVLQAINDRSVEHLRANIDLFYAFAICMREAHCLLRVLHYYGYDVSQLVETGWDLVGMRRLQSELVDFAHEEPFIWSKPDVDAICTALQAAYNEQALSTGSQPPRFAAAIGSSQEPEVLAEIEQHLGQVVQQPSIVQPVYYPRQVPVAVPCVQPPVGYTNHQAPTTNPLPHYADTAEHEVMKIDQTSQICPFFQDRGCTKVGDARRPCKYDHPESMKYEVFCPTLMQGSPCQFGDEGCRYRHNGLHGNHVNIPQPQAQPFANVGAVALANTTIPGGTAPNGKQRDPALEGSYCRAHQKGHCRKGDHCSWLHDISPHGLLYQNAAQVPVGPLHPQSNFTAENYFQNGRLGAQSAIPQVLETKSPCRHLARGSCRYPDDLCKYSHDPAVFASHGMVLPQPLQQPLGDATMGAAASNGDNTNPIKTSRPPRSEMPCRNEKNGRLCSKPTCWFMHVNPESAAYADTDGYAAGDEMGQPQQPLSNRAQLNTSRGRGGRGRGGPHGKDFAYNPQQPLTFQQLPQTQTPADARARLEQFLLNSAPPNVPLPLQSNQPSNRTRGNTGRGNNARGSNRGNASGIQHAGDQRSGNGYSRGGHNGFTNGRINSSRGGYRGGRGGQAGIHDRGNVQGGGTSIRGGGVQVAYAASTGSGGL